MKFVTILNLSCLLSLVLDEMQMGTGLRANLFYYNHSAENQILPQYSYNKTNEMH
jgi:hypothetical protein